jgi:hypothetical protein
MPYKDIELRRLKEQEYQKKHRSKKKQSSALIALEPRFCLHCNVSIIKKRNDAKFCSRLHKSAFYDKQRNHVLEYVKNQKKRRAQALKYYHKDIQKSRSKQLKRQKQNLPAFAAAAAKHRAIKLNRTPSWVTSDDLWIINEAHKLAAMRTKIIGIKFHVDHIIPLQGKLVSGLHVPSNIQVISGSLNVSKHNKFEII